VICTGADVQLPGKKRPLTCQPNASPRSHDESDAKALFECLYLLADSGVRYVKSIRRQGITAGLGDRGKRTEAV